MAYKLVSFTGDQDFELTADRTYVVGRAVTSDIPIFDPTISRRHAELHVTKAGVTVKDLGSSNGTFINGTRITDGTLAANDSVTFGKVVFQVKSLEPAANRLATSAQSLPQAGGTIVKQISMSGGVQAVVLGDQAKVADAPAAPAAGGGQLKVDAATQAERVARKLSLLLDVSQKLSGELDLDKLLTRLVTTTFDVMNVDRVSVLLVTEGGELVPRVSKSRLGDSSAQHVPRSIARKAVEERVAILTDNAVADDRFKGGQSILLQSVRSAMCIPLMAGAEQVLGILYVDNLTATNSFSDEDLQFLIAFGGLGAIAIKNSRFAEQIQREAMVRSNFERYFAPNVAAEIAQQQGAVKLGGDKRPVTILFTDIRGFTSMSEHMSPESIASLLSDTEMVDIIFANGGTLDKFIGDRHRRRPWGALIPHADDVDRAGVNGGLPLRGSGPSPPAHQGRRRGPPSISVGIASLTATLLRQHRPAPAFEYTVIGDAYVGVASRLLQRQGRRDPHLRPAVPGKGWAQEQARRPAPRDPLSVKNRAQAVPVWQVKV